jgi:hypothetical protein
VYFLDVGEGVVDDGGEVVAAHPFLEAQQEADVRGCQAVLAVVAL